MSTRKTAGSGGGFSPLPAGEAAEPMTTPLSTTTSGNMGLAVSARSPICHQMASDGRDWSALDDGPAGLIADRLLAHDVADYLRFRSMCRTWRRCSADPRAHGGLDRRFHPRRWVMLRQRLGTPNSRCFFNSSTGNCIQVDIPELRDHYVLAHTPEGLSSSHSSSS